jgi:hypothetical protein
MRLHPSAQSVRLQIKSRLATYRRIGCGLGCFDFIGMVNETVLPLKNHGVHLFSLQFHVPMNGDVIFTHVSALLELPSLIVKHGVHLVVTVSKAFLVAI